MKRESVIVAASVGLIAASGCTVTPSVEYTKIDASNPHPLTEGQFDTYYLQGSKVKIDLASDARSAQSVPAVSPAPANPPAAGKKKKSSGMLGSGDSKKPAPPAPQPEANLKPGDIVITSTPVENGAFVFALSHDDPFWASTTVNLNKIENTGLVKDIGTDFADYRVEYVNAAAAVITKVAAGMLSDTVRTPSPLNVKRLPVELDLVALLASTDARGARQIELAGREDLVITLGAAPPDAEELSQLTFPMADSRYIYSACRTLTVAFRLPGSEDMVSRSVKIADPNFIQRVALPKKGKITMHSECGISVSTESQPRSENAALIQALAAQGDAIANALGASGKPKGK